MFNLFKQKPKKSTMQEVQKIGGDLDFSTLESYNLLRTNLSFAFPGKTDGKIVGITSPAPSEGKSFTAINLAYSIAKDGKKVLLIDADMRKPSIAEKLHIPFAPGLSNLLVAMDESYIHQCELHENIRVLTSGDIPPNPSELIGTETMHNVLLHFAKAYDYVIVDLPPVMEVPDPIIVSKFLDGVALVVMHEHSYRKDIKECVRKLQYANARILGFIYNGYSSNVRSYYKKYSYRHSYKK